MADRPIPYTAPMIHALLDGRKTMTRRIVNPRPALDNGLWCWKDFCWREASIPNILDADIINAAPFSISDRLWVREAYFQVGHWEQMAEERTKQGRAKWRFVADNDTILFVPHDLYRKGRHHQDPETSIWHKRLGRFMPRAASRLTLIVESVKIERLQTITEEDALAEGAFKDKATGRIFMSMASMRAGGGEWANARDWYADLWDAINGPGSWDQNPWVAAIGFRVVRANIDHIDADSERLLEETASC